MQPQQNKLDGSGLPTGAAPSTGSGRSLFRQAQAGCRESLNRLAERHDGLVHAVVRRQVLGDLPYTEALQAGREGLWRAILRFDPTRGYAFSTYAWPSILHHVWRAVKMHTRASGREQADRCRARQTEWQWRVSTDPATIVAAQSVRCALQSLVAQLPRRLQEVIVARYGLDGRAPCFYREIGAQLGISGERARQLHTEALVWLRHPARSHRLRSLLGRHWLSDYQWAEAEAQRWLRKRGGRRGHS
jgi:RNA polymerase sigma factor (sigma-70 family)